MASLLSSVGVLCSNNFDLSIADPQNVWTTRAAPISGNVVLTGAAIRDTSGIILPGQFNLYISIGSTQWMTMTIAPPKDGSAGFSSCNMIIGCPTSPLVQNPIVTAKLQGTPATTSCVVALDLIGYYI